MSKHVASAPIGISICAVRKSQKSNYFIKVERPASVNAFAGRFLYEVVITINYQMLTYVRKITYLSSAKKQYNNGALI